MPDAVPLTPAVLEGHLVGLAGWSGDTSGIGASFTMDSFPVAVALVERAATSAEAANHHPDIDIRWRTVIFRLVTHDSGGVTMRDINLARRIQSHAVSLGWVVP